jgi:hypothetical protein
MELDCQAYIEINIKIWVPSQRFYRPLSSKLKSLATLQGRSIKLGWPGTVAWGRNQTSDHTITSWAHYQLHHAIKLQWTASSVRNSQNDVNPLYWTLINVDINDLPRMEPGQQEPNQVLVFRPVGDTVTGTVNQLCTELLINNLNVQSFTLLSLFTSNLFLFGTET